jgi:hypothetical protein
MDVSPTDPAGVPCVGSPARLSSHVRLDPLHRRNANTSRDRSAANTLARAEKAANLRLQLAIDAWPADKFLGFTPQFDRYALTRSRRRAISLVYFNPSRKRLARTQSLSFVVPSGPELT